MSNVLEVSNLTKTYKEFVLDGVSFALPKGYIMGFVGPNGAGKTTTISLMLGLKRKEAGTVLMFGEEASHNEDIGVVMDSPNFPADWTLREVENALSPFYPRWDGARYGDCLKKFELSPAKKVKELSRGMTVKLQIAVALSHNAKLLIMDEPTSGLDPVARDEVCEMLQEFVSDGEGSVLFSTHITSDLEKIADYVTMILRGRVHFTGTKDDMIAKYTRVTGGTADISDEHRTHIIGYREHRSGFEGLIETTNRRVMPASVLCESPNLEEIIIFMNKEAKKGANENDE